jgi:O-antigen/teichoic acid export membrane protein
LDRVLKVERFFKSATFRHGALLFLATTFANLLTYLYQMICSRALGVAEYGVFATLIAGYSIAGAFVNALNLTTAKFAAEFRALDDFPRIRLLARLMMRVALLAAVLFLAGEMLALPMLGGYLRLDPFTLSLAGLATASSLLLPPWRGVLQGMQCYTELSLSTTLETVVRLGLGAGLVLAGYRAGGAVTGFTLGSVVSLAFTGFLLRRHVGAGPREGRLKIDTRRLLLTSGGVSLSTLALTVIGFIDVVLVRHFLSARDAGLYGALSLAGKVILISVSFLPTLLLPKAVASVARGESPGPILRRVIAATALLTLAVTALYFAIPATVLRLLAGPAFLAIAPELGRYGVAISLLAATTVAATFKIALHRFHFVPRLCATALLETIGISLFHRDIAQVVDLVMGANLVALLLTLLP